MKVANPRRPSQGQSPRPILQAEKDGMARSLVYCVSVLFAFYVIGCQERNVGSRSTVPSEQSNGGRKPAGASPRPTNSPQPLVAETPTSQPKVSPTPVPTATEFVIHVGTKEQTARSFWLTILKKSDTLRSATAIGKVNKEKNKLSVDTTNVQAFRIDLVEAPVRSDRSIQLWLDDQPPREIRRSAPRVLRYDLSSSGVWERSRS